MIDAVYGTIETYMCVAGEREYPSLLKSLRCLCGCPMTFDHVS